MTDAKLIELCKYVRLYLGPDNWAAIKATTEKEHLLFQKHDLIPHTSYFVKGKRDLLNKFKAFFLTRCLKERPLYVQCSFYEYVEGLSSADKDEFGLNVSKDLLFLYLHKHMYEVGRSRQWFVESAINRIADRNRAGLVTVILSEIGVPEIEECGEMKVINLGGAQSLETVKEILEEDNSEDNPSRYRNYN